MQLLASDPNIFSFGLSSLLSKGSVADFEHVLICCERYLRIRTKMVLILKSLTQQTSTYSISTTETPKQDVISLKINSRECYLLLLSQHVKALRKCVCCDVFLFLHFFSDAFIVNFKQIPRLDIPSQLRNCVLITYFFVISQLRMNVTKK